ncbi:MAG: RNA polymerase sigma factor [Alphaproteobacteria bacterium]|nr:RNA polymerase sigma factor [Alphaproteobacteria bacterium]
MLDRHYLLIYKVAFKLCGHKEDAQDVTQEVCIKVADKLHSYSGDAAFTTWLYQITMNCVRDMQRKKIRTRNREQQFVDDVALNPEPKAQQEQNLMRKQALQRFSLLPDDLREAVLLVAGDGLSHKQAATLLGCAESTVSWRLMKAKQQLAESQGEEVRYGG